MRGWHRNYQGPGGDSTTQAGWGPSPKRSPDCSPLCFEPGRPDFSTGSRTARRPLSSPQYHCRPDLAETNISGSFFRQPLGD